MAQMVKCLTAMRETIMNDDNGDWKYDVTVATVEEAEALLDAVLGEIS